jgi:preprotein translocase subunit SecA
MAQGLLREAWQPPRGLHAQRPFMAQWRVRWRAWSGAAKRQSQLDMDCVAESLSRAEQLPAQALGEAIRQSAAKLRFLGDCPVSEGVERRAWLRQRSDLLGLWCQAAQQVLGMRPHATQVLAALEMHNGHLVQLAPGEGKTLAIGLAAALYASSDRPCHVVTANDYLAERDADLMRPMLALAGLSVVAIAPESPPAALASAYRCDVVYATGKQLLADYLRDGLLLDGVKDPAQRRLWEMQRDPRLPRPVGRGLWVAIVDEADSVLIDEATTPLIISSADDNPMLIEAVLAGKQIFESLQQGVDYLVQTEPVPDIRFTEQGKQRIEDMAFLLPPFWRFPERAQGMVSLAVMARHVYQRDRHYLVDEEGKVVIVDEKTGRVMAGRSWSHGIHQAIEAMEGVELSSPPKTVARMTFQTFFNRYHRLCGASGTLQGIHGELLRTYGTWVMPLAPRVPSRLELAPLRMFGDARARFDAVLEAVLNCQQQGLPVLVGTRKIADTEALSAALQARGVAHRVLNAKHHAEEALIVAAAGVAGAVTVSTNMAGRGTDIMVPPALSERGGLQVLLFEPHEAARIEWQLCGRSGRQGARGRAVAFVTLNDELLVQAFGPAYARLLPLLSPLLLRPSLGGLAVRLAQAITQHKAASQRKRLAERERSVANQLSFSD